MSSELLNNIHRFLFDRRAYSESVRKIKSAKEYQTWIDNGKPVPPPHIVKQITVKEYAKKYTLTSFIETGTYLGEMVEAVKDTFKTIYTIELSQEFLIRAQKTLSPYQHIRIIHGDSAQELPLLLKEITTPCLFWLDGHYSGGPVKGKKDTPIMEELTCIFRHPIDGHVVLIDDARCFCGKNDYPTIDEVSKKVTQFRPDFSTATCDDIIRICKPLVL